MLKSAKKLNFCSDLWMSVEYKDDCKDKTKQKPFKNHY